MKNFPNGFDDWMETHYEVVSFIEYHRSTDEYPDEVSSRIQQVEGNNGLGGLYLLSEMWTDKFENKFQGREWDGDYHDTLEAFLEEENKKLYWDMTFEYRDGEVTHKHTTIITAVSEEEATLFGKEFCYEQDVQFIEVKIKK